MTVDRSTAGNLPESLIDVAETLGLPVALRLIEIFGGQEVGFPVHPRPDHPVIKALGEEAGFALCHFLSGARIYVPHGRSAGRRRSVNDLAASGMKRGEIARALGLSQRHVRRLANGQPDRDPRQHRLFDE